MKRKYIRLINWILAIVMVLSLIPAGALTANAAEKSDYYVAVGDSVTVPYIGADGRPVPTYAELLAEQKGYVFDKSSLVAGSDYTTKDVLQMLETDTATQSAISNAGLITIMLGVNDMMSVVYQAIAENYNASNSDRITAADVPLIMKDRNDPRWFNLLLGSWSLLDETKDKYLINGQLFQSGLKAFSDNLLSIVGTINEYNSNATIIVATQYDPFTEYNGTVYKVNNFNIPLSPLYECMEDGISRMNKVITDNAAAGGYVVADVKTAFDNAHSTENDLYMANPASLSWDIYPTEAGYQVMAAAFAEKTPDAPKYYTISYDKNGGEGVMTSQVVEGNTVLTLPENGFVAPKGYEFAGWAYTADGKKIDKNAITVDQDITLYAVWKVQDLKGEVTISGTM